MGFIVAIGARGLLETRSKASMRLYPTNPNSPVSERKAFARNHFRRTRGGLASLSRVPVQERDKS
jgi:hypothetical protein